MRLPGILPAAARSVSAIALFAAMPVVAHHSYAMFDMTREVSLEGTVRNFQWTNPHIWIDIVVTDKGTGQPVNWSIEGKGPVQLVGDGWRRDSIKKGDKVSMVIHPLKQGTNGGSLLKVLVNGKQIGGASKEQ
jgi:Family of unknown function (DUF6152)